MTTDETQMVVAEPRSLAAQEELSTEDVLQQVQKIQEIMHRVMKEGEHYGTIPGCGTKPVLLQSGAQKLCFVFRLVPRYTIERLDLPGGHREYISTCELTHLTSGQYVGGCVGSCSTMEAKYRYRGSAKIFTGEPVPQQYWALKKTDRAKAQELLGGKGFTAGKTEDGRWEICEVGEKIEHDNPADYYNTILKIAQKRSFVGSTVGSTAASDIFTQDVEDLVANGYLTPTQEEPVQQVQEPQRTSDPRQTEIEQKTAFKAVVIRKANLNQEGASVDYLRSILIQVQAFSHLTDIPDCTRWLDQHANIVEGRVEVIPIDADPKPADTPKNHRAELESICICCVAMSRIPITTDFKTFTLFAVDTPLDVDDVSKALSAFKGKEGQVVNGRGIADLSEKALEITLKKARSLEPELQALAQ